MHNLKKHWLIYSLIVVLSAAVWYLLSYQQINFIQLKVDREQALAITNEYLSTVDAGAEDYRHAAVLKRATATNRYLQKTIGMDGLRRFIDDNKYDMFFWNIRYFKEGQKEEHVFAVSSLSGDIISYSHLLNETAAMEEMDKQDARRMAIDFLEQRFDFRLDEHEPKGEVTNQYDNRQEHLFVFQQNDVSIPWNDEPDGGTGKLLNSVTVSGNRIISFSSRSFVVPEDFKRYLRENSNVSQNLSMIVNVLYTLLFVAAIYFCVSQKNHLAMHMTKKVYIWIGVVIFLVSISGFFNQLESIKTGYDTTAPYNAYFLRFFVNALIGAILASVMVIMPGLSGELVHFKQMQDNKEGSFLHYVQTTFLSRKVAESIIFGYICFFVLLACQSLLIWFGQSYFGVWVEYSWMSSLTTSYFPFLAGITLGLRASLNEEILYRVFAISFGKQIFKKTWIAILISAVIWGSAHSTYPVYPMWFRAVEVSILGVLISCMYLRYGIICILVAHYVFDGFWHSTGYLFGKVQTQYFAGAIFVVVLPLIYAVIAYVVNRSSEEKPLKWHLSAPQLYNLEILKTFLFAHKEKFIKKSRESIKEEISENGWDYAVVDVAVDEFADASEIE